MECLNVWKQSCEGRDGFNFWHEELYAPYHITQSLPASSQRPHFSTIWPVGSRKSVISHAPCENRCLTMNYEEQRGPTELFPPVNSLSPDLQSRFEEGLLFWPVAPDMADLS
jgi:hypothetical protein